MSSLKVLLIVCALAVARSERHEANARVENVLEDRKGAAAPVSVGEGNDIIGYIVVPYPGPYPGLEQRSDLSSLFSL